MDGSTNARRGRMRLHATEGKVRRGKVPSLLPYLPSYLTTKLGDRNATSEGIPGDGPRPPRTPNLSAFVLGFHWPDDDGPSMDNTYVCRYVRADRHSFWVHLPARRPQAIQG